MADKSNKFSKTNEDQIKKINTNNLTENLTINNSLVIDVFVDNVEKEIQSSLPLSFDMGVSENKQIDLLGKRANNTAENNFISNDPNYNFNSFNNFNNFNNTHINYNNFGLVDINSNLMNGVSVMNKNFEKINNLMINNSSNNFDLNNISLRENNEYNAIPSPFNKDGINLSSLYINSLTSRQLEFNQHFPLSLNM